MPITETKFCQSCIERGINPPNSASREWQTGIYYCDECFTAILDNLCSIPVEEVKRNIESIKDKTIVDGPILDYIYATFNVPVELQFDKLDEVQRNHDKIFSFYAPAIVNRSEESLAEEIKQLACALFQIKYRLEPLEERIRVLKEQRRKEKGLADYKDSKEEYAKAGLTSKKPSTVKTGQEEKMAKTLGMNLEEYRAMVLDSQNKEKLRRERQFNILAGNCPACGGVFPCKEHPNEVLK